METENVDRSSEGGKLYWLFFDSPNNKYFMSANDSELKSWGVDFEGLSIDFNSNNVILSFGRKIVAMEFEKYPEFPYRNRSFVHTIMSKNCKKNMIYVYLIPKYDVL